MPGFLQKEAIMADNKQLKDSKQDKPGKKGPPPMSMRGLAISFLMMAVFLTVMVGLSRMYLGVHYPSDVIAGWCIGSAWALLCWTVALWLQRRGQVEGRVENPPP